MFDNTFVMQKVTLNLGELKENSKNEAQNKGTVSLYHFLVFKMLRLKVKENYLLINPNFERINFLLEVQFYYKNTSYSFLIDGKNKVIIINQIKLTNIQKISLEFLKQQKTVV